MFFANIKKYAGLIFATIGGVAIAILGLILGSRVTKNKYEKKLKKQEQDILQAQKKQREKRLEKILKIKDTYSQMDKSKAKAKKEVTEKPQEETDDILRNGFGIDDV